MQTPLPKEGRTRTQRLSRTIDAVYEGYRPGEPDAETRLYEAFRAQARNVVWLTLNREDKALAQDIASRALMALDTFRGDCKISTWFFRIAINEGKRALKSHITNRNRLLPLIITGEDGEERDRDIGAINDNHDARIDLDSIRERLPQKQADLITRKQKGYSLAEIAQETNEPLGTIRSRFRLVKEKVRKPCRMANARS